jgi:hypothetical protein
LVKISFWLSFALGALAMTLNGQAGGSSANLAHSAEKRDLPIGPNIGTLAVLLATILTDGGEWLRVVSKAEACLHEIFLLIGTPAFLDIFVGFYQELETTKLWFRSNREDHPHVFRGQVARKKSPLYMQGTLAILRSDHSPVFRDHCDAFRALLDHLILSCTKPDEQQLFKYLLEVQILADSIYEVVF